MNLLAIAVGFLCGTIASYLGYVPTQHEWWLVMVPPAVLVTGLALTSARAKRLQQELDQHG